MKVALPVIEKEINGKRLVNYHFGKSNLFAIVDTETGEMELLENPALHLERGRGNLIARAFSEKGVEAVLVKEIGPGAFEKLKSFGISIYLVPAEVKFLDDAVEMFKNGNLKILEEPNE